MDNENMAYNPLEHYSAFKKKDVLSHSRTRMELEAMKVRCLHVKESDNRRSSLEVQEWMKIWDMTS